jgi:cytochrome c556
MAGALKERELRYVVLAAAAVLTMTAAAGAQVRPRQAAATIHARQAHYKQMAAAVKGINDQLRGSSPSLPAIRRGSAVLARFAPQVLLWFPRGTGPEAGVRTRARPEIWSDQEGFRRAGAGLLVAARNLDAVARRADIAAIRAAMAGVTRACGACHDDFRAPEE